MGFVVNPPSALSHLSHSSFSGHNRGVHSKMVADTLAHSILHCLVSGRVRHRMALIVFWVGVDLTLHSSCSSLLLLLSVCTAMGWSTLAQKTRYQKEKEKEKKKPKFKSTSVIEGCICSE